jgi:hypothetical protein
MKTNDFTSTITSSKLKENMNKMFGINVNLEKYDREQLEDMRNKLRTRVFQQEGAAGINDLLTNETYQKDKAMLDLLNTRIKEMLGENIAKLRDKMDELNEAKKGVRDIKHVKKAKGTKPDFLDMDKDGDKTEPMKKAIKDKATKEAAEKTPSTWTDKSGKTHPATKVKGDKYTGKEADKDVKEESEKTPSTWTDKSGKTHPATKVKGDKYTGKEAEKTTKEAAEKTPSTWTDKSGNTHPATKVKGDKYTGKEAEKDVKEGKDEGKPGKTFAKIAKSAGKQYGSKEAGERVAGAVRQKLKKASKLKESSGEGPADLLDAVEREINNPGRSFDNLVDVMNATFGSDRSPEFKKARDYIGRYLELIDSASIGDPANGIRPMQGNDIAGFIRDYDLTDYLQWASSMLNHVTANATMGKLKESNTRFKHNVRFVNESLAFLINEDEEGKAKAITAASDMVNDFTSWMQRVGQYQTKAMIELADQIRADFGQQEAEIFKQSVAPALAATLETLTTQREAISNAVAVLAGEADPMDQMGMEPGMDAMPPAEEPGMDIAAPDEMNPPDDEFGASDAAAGAGTPGREMRESKFARKLAESHNIMAKLAK